MEVNETECFAVEHDADVGAARRRFAVMAVESGLDESRANDAALIASELASNIIKHAKHGGLLLGRVAGGVSIAAWDRGPGMNVDACMRDGMSTAGTAGNGLGAVRRLASSWDAYTRATGGVVLTAYVLPKPPVKLALDLAGVAVPYPGLPICGDAWSAHQNGAIVTLIVCDGLGHGDGAAAASRAVIASFAQQPDATPKLILERGDAAAKSTRGAATTVVRVDLTAREATIAGVGNVAAWIAGDTTRQLVTQHGTLGQATPTIREERYAFPPGATLVIASDGIKSRVPLDEHRDLLARSSLTIASTIWRDYTRGRDDATVVVLHEAR